jgi:ribosomal protein L13E
MAPFYLGGRCQCPKCGHKLFTGPREFVREDKIVCTKCGRGTTVGEAEEAGLTAPKADGSEDFTT